MFIEYGLKLPELELDEEGQPLMKVLIHWSNLKKK